MKPPKKWPMPYVGFGNDTLDKRLPLERDDLIDCPICKGVHPVKNGTVDGKESHLLLFYKCGEKIYLAGIAGKSVIGIKADVSGHINDV